jgi:hypothetical protein
MGSERLLFWIVRGQQRQRVQNVFDVGCRPAEQLLEPLTSARWTASPT